MGSNFLDSNLGEDFYSSKVFGSLSYFLIFQDFFLDILIICCFRGEKTRQEDSKMKG